MHNLVRTDHTNNNNSSIKRESIQPESYNHKKDFSESKKEKKGNFDP